MNTEREPGYYWIKQFYSADWEIAEWSGRYWFYIDSDNYDADDKFEVDERQIIRTP